MKDNRLFKILYYILEKGKVTANELADKFEVSVRTIYRDIDSISSAGIPIYALQGKGGGIEIAEDFVLSKSLLSENEKQQIMSALQGLDNTTKQSENELLTKLSALFKMKNTSWIEVDFNNWQNNKLYEKTFDDIKSAILSKNIISFTYFSSNAMKNKTDNEITDFTVYPLEGFWKKANGEELDKNKLEYTLMIKQPDFITQEIFKKALENVKKKKPNVLYDEISFREIEEGKSIHILHVGSYDDEPKSFELMNEFARKFDLTRIGDFHKEIYLSNKNRTSEEKQKTILRYSVK